MQAIDEMIRRNSAKKLRIAVVGDAMTDVYVHGRLDVGQEGCPKFVEESRVIAPGGAANATRQLENWNAIVGLYSQVKSIMPVKTRFLVDGKHVFRHDDDEMDCDAVLKDARKRVLRNLVEHAPDAVLISDYDKGFLDERMIRAIITEFAGRIPVVADAKRHPSVYYNIVIKCNSDYFHRYQDPGIDSMFALNNKLVVTYGCESPLVNCKVVEERRYPVQCVNHVGAGDCFAAHLTLALAHGFSLEDAAIVAHAAGRVYVQHPHNRPPWPHEIRKNMQPCRGKILTFGHGGIEALRKSVPGKVVFTCGVFRMPHAGHAWLMDWARRQGDALVVGINDDESAAALRPGQLVLPLAERLEILCGLQAVDWVVPFAGDTPATAIEALGPDLFVKGADSIGKPVGCGMKVLYAPPSPFHERHATQLTTTIHCAGEPRVLEVDS